MASSLLLPPYSNWFEETQSNISVAMPTVRPHPVSHTQPPNMLRSWRSSCKRGWCNLAVRLNTSRGTSAAVDLQHLHCYEYHPAVISVLMCVERLNLFPILSVYCFIFLLKTNDGI